MMGLTVQLQSEGVKKGNVMRVRFGGPAKGPERFVQRACVALLLRFLKGGISVNIHADICA